MAAVSLRFRLGFTAVAVVLTGAIVFAIARMGRLGSDFDQQVFAARLLLQGRSPYDDLIDVLPRFFLGYVYPLPAAFTGLPFVPLSPAASHVAFALVSTVALAWVVSRDGMLRAPLFASGAFLANTMIGQWSTMLTAAALAPALAWVAVVKPNYALAFLIARWDRRYLVWFAIPAALLGLIALAILPSWPFDWLRTHRASPGWFTPPLLWPGGFLLLLALLQRRTFEGRLLLGCACIPQTGFLYDTLPLFLVAKTQAQGWFLWAFSIASVYVHVTLARMEAAGPTGVETMDNFFSFRAGANAALILLMYLPALAIVLWNGWRERAGTFGSGRVRRPVTQRA